MFSSKVFFAVLVTVFASSVFAATVPATEMKDVAQKPPACATCWPAILRFPSEGDPDVFELADSNEFDGSATRVECYYTEIDDKKKQTFCFYDDKTGKLTEGGNGDGFCPPEANPSCTPSLEETVGEGENVPSSSSL
ncbi:hypothetical protein CPC08DRAFT_323597 [Agrocybe pediades]|nr:hypothetical protein CPC08DRAFT_323597 [Agrocybe pediades]